MSDDPFWTPGELADFVTRIQAATECRRLTITIELQEFTIFEVDPLARAEQLLASAAGNDGWWDQAKALEAHWEA